MCIRDRICAALFLTFLLYIAWVRMPVKINPHEITSCPCTVTDNAISLQPQGFRNPHKKKQWKVTARYDEEESTLYVSCWLKADDTFSSFDYESKKLNRKDYGEIDKMVLLGGWLNQEAVSYTHLDVYKRQPLRHGNAFGQHKTQRAGHHGKGLRFRTDTVAVHIADHFDLTFHADLCAAGIDQQLSLIHI